MCDRKSKHHWAWPKRKYHGTKDRRVLFYISERVHRAYHEFWFAKCRDFPWQRQCLYGYCRFGCICYYEKDDKTTF